MAQLYLDGAFDVNRPNQTVTREAISTSAGVTDANKIISSNSLGLVDSSFLPTTMSSGVASTITDELVIMQGSVTSLDYIVSYSIASSDNSAGTADGIQTVPSLSVAGSVILNAYFVRADNGGNLALNTVYTGIRRGIIPFASTASGFAIYLNTTNFQITTTVPTLTTTSPVVLLGVTISATEALFIPSSPRILLG